MHNCSLSQKHGSKTIEPKYWRYLGISFDQPHEVCRRPVTCQATFDPINEIHWECKARSLQMRALEAVAERMFSTCPDERPGTGLLLLRTVIAAVLVARGLPCWVTGKLVSLRRDSSLWLLLVACSF